MSALAVPNILAQINDFYENLHGCFHETQAQDPKTAPQSSAIDWLTAVDISMWVQVMEKIAKDRYDGTLKKGKLPEDYIARTYAELSQAAEQGYGKGFLSPLSFGKIP